VGHGAAEEEQAKDALQLREPGIRFGEFTKRADLLGDLM
jgi:hypothetical protein